MNQILQNLDTRIKNWLHAHHWDRLHWLIALLIVLVVFFATAFVVAVAHGISWDLWTKEIVPWFSGSQTIANFWFFMLFLWCTVWFIVSVILLVKQLRLQRKMGQYQLALVGTFNPEFQELSKKARLLDDVVTHLNRELYVRLKSPTISQEDVTKFIDALFLRIFGIWKPSKSGGTPNKVNRAAVYTREDNSDYIRATWDHKVGDGYRWYVGPLQPNQVTGPRGIPGSVFWKKESRVVADIREDDDFADPNGVPKEEMLPCSAIYALICSDPDVPAKAEGVFCLESEHYSFSEDDLALVKQAVASLARLLETYKERQAIHQGLQVGQVEGRQQ